MHTDRALSEGTSLLLIIVMILILFLVIAAFVFGRIPLPQEAVIVASDLANPTINSKNIITVFHRAGDEFYLNKSLSSMHEVGIYIDNSTNTSRAQPVYGLNLVKPGTMLYIYYNSSKNVYRITTNSATIASNESQSITSCPRSVRVVDERSKILITRASFSCIPTGAAPTVGSMNTTTGYRGWPIARTIIGTNFLAGATAKFNRTGYTDITATSCEVLNSTRMNCVFNLYERIAGTYNVVVTNPDGKQGMRANYFPLSSPAPAYTSISNTSGYQATTVVITNLRGNYFQPTTTFTFKQGSSIIPLTSVTVRNATSVTGSVIIPLNTAPGYYNLTMMNTDNGNFTRANAFYVYSNAPTVTGSTPNTGVTGWKVNITNLAGTNFQNGATVRLVNASAGADIVATDVVVVSATRINCTFDLTGAPAARRNITVTNPDLKSGTLANGFTVTGNAPTLTARNPTAGNRGWPVNIITLTGTGFQPGAGVVLRRAGYSDIAATGVNVASPTTINAGTFNLLNVASGAWTVLVINTDGRASNAMGFTVNSLAPTFSSINPNTAARGSTINIVNLAGGNFQPGAMVQLQNATRVISVASGVNVAAANSINAGQLTIGTTGVRNGTYSVNITNTDGQRVVSGAVFTVT